MNSKRQVIVVVGALGALAAAFAVKKLLEDPLIRRRLGLRQNAAEESDSRIDHALEDSFPASDPPSNTPITSIGGLH